MAPKFNPAMHTNYGPALDITDTPILLCSDTRETSSHLSVFFLYLSSCGIWQNQKP